MIGWGLLAAIGGLHVGILLAAFKGPESRLIGGLFLISINYGLRRLLFLDGGLGHDVSAWFGLILLGDLVLILVVVMSAMAPAARPRLLAEDLAVLALVLGTTLMVTLDDRTSLTVRLAHWKDEYLYLLAYPLARLNGPWTAQRLGVLAGLAVLGVAVALWQAVVGPLSIDLSWVASGRSVLVGEGLPAGAATLGNLEAGWLRPYGVFGNGTDFGVFLACIGLLAVARCLPAGQASIRQLGLAVIKPLPMLCILGLLLTVVRLTWAVWIFGIIFLALFMAADPAARVRRLLAFGSGAALLGGIFVIASASLASSDDLLGRAFVTGTYGARVEAQVAYVAHLAETPSVLLAGEGFGLHGAAARKFGAEPPWPIIHHHSRIFDLLQDGGLVLVLLVLAPLALCLRGGARGDPVRAAALSFACAFLLCATLLGAKSALLQTLFWAMIGLASTRLSAHREGRLCPL